MAQGKDPTKASTRMAKWQPTSKREKDYQGHANHGDGATAVLSPNLLVRSGFCCRLSLIDDDHRLFVFAEWFREWKQHCRIKNWYNHDDVWLRHTLAIARRRLDLYHSPPASLHCAPPHVHCLPPWILLSGISSSSSSAWLENQNQHRPIIFCFSGFPRVFANWVTASERPNWIAFQRYVQPADRV